MFKQNLMPETIKFDTWYEIIVLNFYASLESTLKIMKNGLKGARLAPNSYFSLLPY